MSWSNLALSCQYNKHLFLCHIMKKRIFVGKKNKEAMQGL